MYGFLLAILILDGLFLGVVILLQSGKGGGLAAMGGSGTMPTEGIMGGRQATNLLTRATWTSGTVFMVLALVLSIMSSRASRRLPSPCRFCPDSRTRVPPRRRGVRPRPVTPGPPVTRGTEARVSRLRWSYSGSCRGPGPSKTC